MSLRVTLSFGERFLNWYAETRLYIRGQRGKSFAVQRELDWELARQLNAWIATQRETTERDSLAAENARLREEREPSQAEGDAAEGGPPNHKRGECWVAPWTGRRCRHCSRWVWGGPTACVGCADRAENRAACEALFTGDPADEGKSGTIAEHIRWPAWWLTLRDNKHVHDNPVLYTAAYAGYTPEQAILALAEQYDGVLKRATKLAALRPPPPIVLQVTQEECDRIVDGVRGEKP